MNWLTKLNTKVVGSYYEIQAARYLQQQGLHLIMKNFHCRYGEIDLIMRDQQTLVFVEVKYRKSAAFGGATSALTQQKLKKIELTANYYLQKQNLNSNLIAYRIDLIAIENTTIRWLQAVS